MPEGLVKELREVEPTDPAARPRRPGGPSRCSCAACCASTRSGRWRASAILGALDLAGLFLAIYTALVLKTAIVAPDQLGQMWAQAKDYFPLGGLVMLLLFARSGLYRDRAQRPGFSRVIASLFQVTLVVLIYAEIEGEAFQSYYIFYGSLFFALLYVSSLRWVFERVSGMVLRAAGYRRRAVLVGSGSNIQAVSHALRDSQRDRALRLRHAHARRAARRPARLPLARAARAPLRRDRRGADRRRRLPPGRGRRAGRPVPPARRARARRAVDDGDPDGPGRVRPRPGAAAVRAQAAGLRGRRLRDQADLRPRRRDAAAGRAVAGA